MSTKFRFGMVLALVASLFSVTLAASANDNDNGYHEIATDEFYDVWKRTDLPVQEGKVQRTWIWGPGAHSELLTEDYVEGDDGTRHVQYFDKSRMEMPTGDDVDDKDSTWYITQGRLAYELMTGNIQLGDHEYYENGPSQRSAAGDLHDTTAPTYAVMGQLMDAQARETGHVITQFVDRHGNITNNYDYEHYGVTDKIYDEVTDHNIASVFWNFMNSTGIVYDDGHYKSKSDHLFNNAYYAVGRPLTEAYWARVTVGGEEQDVLIQAFERRVLTYTPNNPKGWEVESGNIGQHYYDWRYNVKGGIDDDNGDTGDNGGIADDGSFDVGGDTTIDIGIGDTETATATVMLDGSGVEGVTIIVELDDGTLISLDELTGTTDVDGEVDFVIEGLLAGTATLNAYADLDDSGDFDAGVDLDLGEITVNVGDDDDNGDIADDGSFDVDGSTDIDLDIGDTDTATATVTLDGSGVEGATVLVEIDDDTLISLDGLSGTTDASGELDFVITGLAAGTATLNAYVDLDGSGDVDGDDLDLGQISVDVSDV